MMETITRDQKVEVHPAADLFPQMAEAEFQTLKDDIERCGVREPVSLDADGRLLDGRHRLRACRELGMDTPCQVYEGADVVDFVLSLNLNRRHLNETQRAFVAAKVADQPRGARTDLVQICTKSIAEAADLMHVSKRLVNSAAKVLKHGVPELVTAVENGDVRVSAADDVTSLPEDEQRALLAEGPVAVRTKARELREARKGKAREATIETAVPVEPVLPEVEDDPVEAEPPEVACGEEPRVTILETGPILSDAECERLLPPNWLRVELGDALDAILDQPQTYVLAYGLRKNGLDDLDKIDAAVERLSDLAMVLRRCKRAAA